MENTLSTNVVLEKKLDNYNCGECNNFIAPHEITVTITINEYRELVKNVATMEAQIKKANEDKYLRDSENKSLKEEVAKLKAELYEMQSAQKTNKEEDSND